MSDEVSEDLERLQALCLVFPEAVEDPAGVGNPAWKVRGKIFAMRHSLHDAARWSVWCKAGPGVQELLVGSAPERFFRPPYVGHRGWIGAYLDVEVDWDELRDLIEESWRMTAPKRLVETFDERSSDSTVTERSRTRDSIRRDSGWES